MKNKIKEALRQEYKSRLELHDEQLEGVAAFAATFVTDEAKIEEFVKNEATFSMLKSYQSILDKDRAKRKSESENGQQGSENGNNQSQQQQQQSQQSQGVDVDALIERLTAAMEAKLNPLSDRIAAFEAAKAKSEAVAALDKFIDEWDYAEGFPKERDMAKHIAMKVYKAGGEQMNGTQLIAAFREEFDPAVKERGVTDFSKPFKSDGGAADNHQALFEAMAKRQQERQGAVAGE